MENTKHTKGEWYMGVKSGKVYSKDNSTNMSIQVECDTKEERNANAKLIASAPDMLEALQSLIRNMESKDHRPTPLTIRMANNAIKKATE